MAAQTFRDFAVLEAWTRNRGIDGTYDGEGPGILYAGGHVRRAQSSPSAATSRVRRSRPNLIRYPLFRAIARLLAFYGVASILRVVLQLQA